MDKDKLLCLLKEIASGNESPESALEQLKDLPYADLGFARLDLHRSLRHGYAEVVFSPGKTAEQIISIVQKLRESSELVIATRADEALAEKVLKAYPEARYEKLARALVFGKTPDTISGALIVNVVTAGTADIPVAEECALFLKSAGLPVQKLYDVGVAGIHRLLDNLPILRRGAITVVCAGMDGALPSVVGGILDGPVIAVPTSVGYGAAFEGLAPLLSMLNSCAAGITVVNIDNGFGAAYAALRMHNAMTNVERNQRPAVSVGT
ncbi:MAG: 1-(5-phosphoribosyl)-5-amino-4-imidazole-carboxylate carboxylase [Cyanobacteria bacterium DS2.3.42]|nr:1-(5-phosphoribosyl)-5-amino-4-imidazole-carboxylate carboxylase [Cyanobacteria bacterium DS2.3.42]